MLVGSCTAWGCGTLLGKTLGTKATLRRANAANCIATDLTRDTLLGTAWHFTLAVHAHCGTSCHRAIRVDDAIMDATDTGSRANAAIGVAAALTRRTGRGTALDNNRLGDTHAVHTTGRLDTAILGGSAQLQPVVVATESSSTLGQRRQVEEHSQDNNNSDCLGVSRMGHLCVQSVGNYVILHVRKRISSMRAKNHDGEAGFEIRTSGSCEEYK